MRLRGKRLSARSLVTMAYRIRRDVLAMAYTAHLGHIAPSLSIVDILTTLYFHYLRVDPNSPTDPSRDRFILSKGHAVSALYATIYRRGFLTRRELLTYCTDGGMLSTHPLYDIRHGVELTTGSLGHGLSVGAGMAYGLRQREQKDSRVVVLLSDAELNSGSTWEAVMFAGHHHLSNLLAVVDMNGLQAYGRTRDVIALEPIDKKWKEFGWRTIVADGHNVTRLTNAYAKASEEKNKPTVVFARTIGGKGVSYMENLVDWHYWSMDKEKYQKAREDIARLHKKSI